MALYKFNFGADTDRAIYHNSDASGRDFHMYTTCHSNGELQLANVKVLGSMCGYNLTLGNNGNGSIYSAGDIYFQHTGRQVFMYDGSGAYTLKIYNASSENVRLTGNGNSWLNGGNVGIGTDSPSTKLHVCSDTPWIRSEYSGSGG